MCRNLLKSLRRMIHSFWEKSVPLKLKKTHASCISRLIIYSTSIMEPEKLWLHRYFQSLCFQLPAFTLGSPDKFHVTFLFAYLLYNGLFPSLKWSWYNWNNIFCFAKKMLFLWQKSWAHVPPIMAAVVCLAPLSRTCSLTVFTSYSEKLYFLKSSVLLDSLPASVLTLI